MRTAWEKRVGGDFRETHCAGLNHVRVTLGGKKKISKGRSSQKEHRGRQIPFVRQAQTF